MPKVIELFTLDTIRRLSLASNFKYGKAILKRGGIELINKKPREVEAWVGGLDGKVIEGAGSRRRTYLYATPKGLAWHCTGNPKNHDIFCKHCVALALFLLESR